MIWVLLLVILALGFVARPLGAVLGRLGIALVVFVIVGSVMAPTKTASVLGSIWHAMVATWQTADRIVS